MLQQIKINVLLWAWPYWNCDNWWCRSDRKMNSKDKGEDSDERYFSSCILVLIGSSLFTSLGFVDFVNLKAGYTLVTKYAKIGAKCEKWKVYSGVFCTTFFAFRISHQGRHACENSKDFVVYFFAALIKHKIHLECEKCIVSVSHFVACFAKTFAKYLRNAKYKKCIADLRLAIHFHNPLPVVNSVFSWSGGLTSTCQYPLFKSIVQKHLAPWNTSKMSSIRGCG